MKAWNLYEDRRQKCVIRGLQCRRRLGRIRRRWDGRFVFLTFFPMVLFEEKEAHLCLPKRGPDTQKHEAEGVTRAPVHFQVLFAEEPV